MKKVQLTIIAMLLASSNIFAHDIEVANAEGVIIYYVWTNNNTELAVSYRGNAYSTYNDEYTGDVIIPESVNYNGKIYSVTSIGSEAFEYCRSLKSVTIPNSVTSIGSEAFFDCRSLTSVTIPNKVTSIGAHVFSGCSSLSSVTIPNSVTSIGWGAFSGCSALSSVDIPANLKTIGNGAFSSCSGLASLTIPNSVTSISSSAFTGCSGLTSIVVENGNQYYDSRDNCNAIIETGSNTLIAGCMNTIIPDGVTSIGSSAFSSCSGLASLTIPNSVTSVSSSAFYGCSGLTSIKVESENSVYDSRDNCNAIIETSSNRLLFGCKNTIIPNSVTSIESKAFYGCSSLTSIIIPNSVSSIGDNAFYGCSSLTSVTFSNGFVYIGKSAFDNCILSFIMMNTDNPFMENGTFSQYYNKAILFVPVGTKTTYQSAEGWSKFNNIYEEDNTQEVNSETFNAIETPLTFEAVSGKVTVTVNNYWCSYSPSILYRIDGGSWTGMSLKHNECHGSPIYENVIPAGKIVQIRAVRWDSNGTQFSDHLSISCDVDCYVYGNVLSLNRLDYAMNYEETGGSFRYLFYKNTHIKNHPEKALVLPSTKLTTSCYWSMFEGCTGLTSAPELPATDLDVAGCYKDMFKDCKNLNFVTCLATSISGTNATTGWLSGVSATGTFIKPASMTSWDRNENGIPIGWNVSIPEASKCAKPTISVIDGKLEFSCATEDVEYNWSIKTNNGSSGKGNNVPFTQTFIVSVYASKSGYENSDVTTQEFSGSGLSGDVDGNGVVNVADHVKLSDIIMNQYK